jgi:hypothetical protein
MKKIQALLTLFILLGTISATAVPLSVEKTITTPVTSETGTYEGEIGYKRSGEWNAVGEISGTYNTRNRFIKFNGQWEITEGQYAGITGTMRGFIVKRYIFFRAAKDGSDRSLPFVGFFEYREETKEFGGRFMSTIGPALYFKGTYQ